MLLKMKETSTFYLEIVGTISFPVEHVQYFVLNTLSLAVTVSPVITSTTTIS